MIDLRPILAVVGLLLVLLAAAMGLPAALDANVGSADWKAFAASAAVTLFVGLCLVLANRTRATVLTVRQAFLVAALGWLAVAAFAALPFAFSALGLSATDAFFEAMSGITTTGSTVVTGLDHAPGGILLWRALLQWLGGVGIIVMAVAVLPVLKIGGMQMFQVEGAEPADKAMPRAAKVAGAIAVIYLGLTVALVAALTAVGMTGFEAVIHAMATISTGGFSTSDASLTHFDNAGAEAVITLGMMVGGMPFLLLLRLSRGHWRTVLRDDQLRWYVGILVLATLGVSTWLVAANGLPLGRALRFGAFTVTSFMTGTGFFNADFAAWTGLPAAILFFLTFVGGCAGSTAGGIKVFRLQVLLASARVQLVKLLRPHTVMVPTYNRRTIADTVADSVMGFLFVYSLAFAVLAMALAMLGVDFLTALSGAASALSNVGPGLGGVVGPNPGLAHLPDAAKWLLAAGMLFGRLEMFVLLVLFVPSFWKP